MPPPHRRRKMSVNRRNSKRRKSTQRKSLRRGRKMRYVGGSIKITKNSINEVDLNKYIGKSYKLTTTTITQNNTSVTRITNNTIKDANDVLSLNIIILATRDNVTITLEIYD